jgi:hypothetical protein
MIKIDLTRFDWSVPGITPPIGFAYIGTIDFDGVHAAAAISPSGDFCAVRCGFVWMLPQAETAVAYAKSRRYYRRAAYWKPRG